jgi:hypothetical protein
VVKGAEGDFFHGFISILEIEKAEVFKISKSFSTSFSFFSCLSSSASKDFFVSPTKVHTTLNKLSSSNA